MIFSVIIKEIWGVILNRKKIMSFIKLNEGMTLIEVMILMTVLSLIALGTTTLLKTATEIQMKSELKEVLLQVRTNMIQTLEDDNSWGRTISSYPFTHANGLGCLRDSTTTLCNHDPAPRLNVNFNVRTDGDGAGASSLYYESAQPTTGIAPDGTFCTTFNTTTGNDLCPFRYNLDLQFTCPTGQLTCSKPKVQIFGRFASNPLNRSGYLARLNIGDLDFTVEKFARTRFEPFIIRHYSTGSGGGGNCVGGATTTRELTEILTDAGGNVLGLNIATNRFRLKKGEYTCTITAQVHDIPTGFSISLEQATGPNPITIPISSGYTGAHESLQAYGTIRLNVTQNSPWFHIIQYCVQNSSPFGMGMPTPGYSGASFTSINCVRTS